MGLLKSITKLSHEFGAPRYVRGGGGNTSCKDGETLWVKPSGTTLSGLTPDSFVALERAALAPLYVLKPPDSAVERESMVKEIMAGAVRPERPGRASVEAPLHDSLNARYVVHTHPALVNGLTCALGGARAASRLFPDALWVPYIDPGYALCMYVRRAVRRYREERGREPAVILLENHGVFVAGDTPEEIRDEYQRIMDTLTHHYAEAGVSEVVAAGERPGEGEVAAWRAIIADALGAEGAHIAVSGWFAVGNGPISPDHMVYAKSYPFDGVLSAENLRAFQESRGYAPRVIVAESGVLGIGATGKTAELALELALDGALVRQLARAFGGIRYLSDESREFIEGWEVESYRARQV